MKRLFLSFVMIISLGIGLMSCGLDDLSEFSAHLIGDWDAVYFVTNLVTNKTGYPPDITVTVPITNYFPLVTTISISNDTSNSRFINFTSNIYTETKIITGPSPSTHSLVREWDVFLQTDGNSNIVLSHETGPNSYSSFTTYIGMSGELLKIKNDVFGEIFNEPIIFYKKR